MALLNEMVQIWERMHRCISWGLSILFMAGYWLLLYLAFKRHDGKQKKISLGIALIVLVNFALGFYRASSRYFLILTFVAIFLVGWLFCKIYQKSKIAGSLIAIIPLVVFGFKFFHIDPFLKPNLQYLRQLAKTAKKDRDPILVPLCKGDRRRLAKITELPFQERSQYDIPDCDQGALKRFWQRYAYLHDAVYLIGFFPRGKEVKEADIPITPAAMIEKTFQNFHGRHKKKFLQCFRVHHVNDQMPISATASAEIPCLQTTDRSPSNTEIAPNWFIFGIAEKHYLQGVCQYTLAQNADGLQIKIRGTQRCTLCSAAINLRQSVDCYLEYNGKAPVPLDISLIIQGDGIYRDVVVTYLPMDATKRSVEFSLYPEMNPEQKDAFLIIRMPEGGELEISQLRFEREK